MKMKTETGIGYSPLTEKVYLGKQNKAKGMWVGDKKDITNDFVGVCFEYFEVNTIREISGSQSGKTNLFINIDNTKEKIERLIKNLNKRLDKIKAKQDGE